MTTFQWIFSVYVVIGFFYWFVQFILIWKVIKHVPILKNLNLKDPEKWPKVSVIMPARNEEDHIEEALRKRLADEYPSLELILVEDRSTDRTPEICDRLAAENPKLKIIHIKELPQGWLGKVYAMKKGVEIASGDWLIMSDADVFFEKTAIKRAVAYAESRGLDHLGVLPDMYRVKNPVLNFIMMSFLRMIFLAARVWAVEDPKSRASIGVGAFNMVRRSAYDKTPGFEWLKMEVADDIGLGYMMKKFGAKSSAVNGCGLAGVYFYETINGMALGTERAGFTSVGNFNPLNLLVGGLLLFLMDWAVLFALIPCGITWLPFLGIAGIITAIILHITTNKWTGRPIYEAFFWMVPSPVMSYMFFRAGILGAIRGGIYWRGTFYSTVELKKGRRFTL